MKKVFLDSSVLVAACASITGASAFILGYAKLKKMQALVSLDVIGEARHNVSLKLTPAAKKRLVYFLKFANLLKVKTPTLENIALCEKCIHEKDAPILAAAKQAKSDFLITLDRKHFFQPEVLDFAKPIQLMTPGDFVVKVLRKNK